MANFCLDEWMSADVRYGLRGTEEFVASVLVRGKVIHQIRAICVYL